MPERHQGVQQETYFEARDDTEPRGSGLEYVEQGKTWSIDAWTDPLNYRESQNECSLGWSKLTRKHRHENIR
jgi:hypothetical protein